MMKNKRFDCVEMKRRGAARIHERLKNMTLEQKIDYWRRRSQAFRVEQEREVTRMKTPDRPTP